MIVPNIYRLDRAKSKKIKKYAKIVDGIKN